MGFLPAAELMRIAEVPSFSVLTAHSAIARNVLNPPIKEWQRPLSEERVERIRRFFSDTGEIMPNPVLLSANGTMVQHGITARPETGDNGTPWPTWRLEVPEPEGGGAKPLWILDGQHRIAGMARSAQAQNPVPFVLLVNADIVAYQPPGLAKLFAQVTTSAEPLNPLHNEWLTYAFELGNYSSERPTHDSHRQAMDAVARLCDVTDLPTGEANPFFNRIKFNPFPLDAVVRPSGGGFALTCVELKELIRTQYFVTQGATPWLSPADLASQLGLAYIALQRTVQGTQSETVFFGEGAAGHKAMQDGLLVGLLTYLRRRSAPGDWQQVLKGLNFHKTDWDFKSWVQALGGTAGTDAKTIAWGAFAKMFGDNTPPPGSNDLADYFQGNSASVTLEASFLTPTQRPRVPGRLQIQLGGGVTTSRDVAERQHLKLASTTANVARVEVVESPFGWRFSAVALRRGVLVGDPRTPNPFRLKLRLIHYGATASEATITIKLT